MTISSMTGFAARRDSDADASWQWEIKSVNGRNLDIRCRLGPGFDSLEPEVRRLIAQSIQRGHINVSLAYDLTEAARTPTINRPILDAILEASSSLVSDGKVDKPRLDGLLRINGILDFKEPQLSGSERAARDRALLDSLAKAIESLRDSRREEGARLAIFVADQMAEFRQLSGAARECAACQPDAIKQKLVERLKDVLEAKSGISEDRLAQEVAMLASKADVREELDRLESHLTSCDELLGKPGAIGRKLDFLAQELSRETNTLCAKSSVSELTGIGLAMKAVIEQFREQVQNIE